MAHFGDLFSPLRSFVCMCLVSPAALLGALLDEERVIAHGHDVRDTVCGCGALTHGAWPRWHNGDIT